MTETRIPIPGCWGCPRCGFQLNKRVIRRDDGEVFVNAEQKREVCPNDGATLEQVCENPEDQLIVSRACCYDLACPRCYGSGWWSIGWRYRDEPDDGSFHEFDDSGDRG